MINSKIIQALKPLNVPTYWMHYTGKVNEYIIFQTNNQDDTNFHDDIADTEEIEIGLIYWFNANVKENKLDKIKLLMKQNGFMKISEKDMKDEDFYGRSFQFKYIKSL